MVTDTVKTMDNVSQLLAGVAEIREKYEEKWRKTGEKYNIFRIAGI